MSLSKRLEDATAPILVLTPSQGSALTRIRARYENGDYHLESVPCYCGGDESVEIAKRDRYGLPVTTLLCRRCGLMRTSPRFTPETNRRFYAEDYRALYDDTENIEPFFLKQARQGLDILKGATALFQRVKTVYDIGCGAGGMLYAFSKAGKEVAGCDFNTRYLEFGQKLGLPLTEGGVEALLGAAGGPADLVILSHVLEHFLDLKGELEEALRAVRPGGYMLIIVPTVETISDLYNGDIRLYLQNAHTYHFSEPTLTYVLQTVGVRLHCISDRNTALVQRPEEWRPGAHHPAALPTANFDRVLDLLTALEDIINPKKN